MINAIIIDDDSLNIDLLTELLKKYSPDVNILATATNVEDGIEIIVKHKPALLFLDIELHGLTSFDILAAIPDTKAHIIFVTAHKQYAIDAFKYYTVDYLLKPIKIQQLLLSIHKYKQLFVHDNSAHTSVKRETSFLSVSQKDHIELIRVEDIIYLEASNTYTKIYTKDNKVHLSTKTLKENETNLIKSNFVRVHHSFVINIAYIDKYIRSKTGTLLLNNGVEIPISASKKKEISDLLNL